MAAQFLLIQEFAAKAAVRKKSSFSVCRVAIRERDLRKNGGFRRHRLSSVGSRDEIGARRLVSPGSGANSLSLPVQTQYCTRVPFQLRPGYSLRRLRKWCERPARSCSNVKLNASQIRKSVNTVIGRPDSIFCQ